MKEKYFDIVGIGYSVKCKLYCADANAVKKLIISCHGFGGSKENAAAKRVAERMLPVHKDAALLTFDWPCHGEDVKPRFTLADCDTYLTAVLEYARERFSPESISFNGTSFGGYAVLKYMHEHGSPFDSVVLRCPAVNLHEIFTGLYLTENDLDKLRRGKDAIVGFEKKFKINRQFLDSLAENDIMRYDFSAFADTMLIMHGTRDETVPIDAVRRFAEQNDLMLIEINGADHMFKDPARMSEYVNNTVDFILG